jgi:peptidyl-prolyl cis-trans isomerase SurA
MLPVGLEIMIKKRKIDAWNSILMGLGWLLAISTLQAQSLRAPSNNSGFSLGASSPSAASNPEQVNVKAPPQVMQDTKRQSSDYIVALVDSEPVTNQEILVQMQQWLAQMANQRVQLPPSSVLLKELMEKVISEKSQLQWASQQGIKVQDTEIDQAESSLASRNNMNVEEFRSKLKNTGISFKQFKTELQHQLILQKLRDKEVNARIKITDLEIDLYLKDLKANVKEDQVQIEIAQILVRLPDAATPEQEKTALDTINELKEKLKSKADFFDLAQKFSQAPDKGVGGRMGLRLANKYPELFTSVLMRANVGDVVGPVRSGAGLHLLKLVEKSSDQELTSNQTHVRHILLRPSGQDSMNAVRVRLFNIKKQIDSAQADFATVAKEISQDGSAQSGGDLGWASPGMFVPEFEETMNRLKLGEVSDPVVSRFGVHLIEVLERRKNPMTIKEQRDLARNALRESKFEQAFSDWAQEIRGRAFIEYRDEPQTLSN